MLIVNQLPPEKLEKVAYIFKTVGHPVRLAIIELLTNNERLSVNEICGHLDVEQSLVSHHLTNMKLRGVLDNKREGKNIYYSLKLREMEKVMECLRDCEI